MLVGFAALLSGVPVGSAEGRRYHAHDKVAIVANTVGPFNNPTETYPVTVARYCVCMFINDFPVFLQRICHCFLGLVSHSYPFFSFVNVAFAVLLSSIL